MIILAPSKCFRAGRSIGPVALFLTSLAFLPPIESAAQQLDLQGASLYYNHDMEFFDTVNNEAENRLSMETVPNTQGRVDVPWFPSAVLESTGGNPTSLQGSYNLISSGTFAEMDLKSQAHIEFVADEIGSYDFETAPDGVWDYVTASNYNSLVFVDQMLFEFDPDFNEFGEEYKVIFRWNTTNNDLATFTEAHEEVVAVLDPLGELTEVQNGFTTEIDYEIKLQASFGEQESGVMIDETGTHTPLRPLTGDPVEDILELQDHVVDFQVTAQVGVPVDLVVQFDFNLDFRMYSPQGRPDIQTVLDLSRTLDAVAFEVYDSDGNRVEGVTVTSAVGVDYLAIGPGIPEPQSLALALGCLAGAGWRRRGGC